MSVNGQGASSLRYLGYQQVTSFSTVKGLNAPPGTTLALVTPSTNSVRWRDDGMAPSATVGYPLAAGQELQYDANGWATLQFIPQTGSSVLDILYYGP